MIAGADINLSVEKNRAGPDAYVFTAEPDVRAVGCKSPNEFAIGLFVRPHDAVFRRSVNEAIGHGRRRVRIHANATLPNKAAVCRINAVKIAAFGSQIDPATVDRDAAFDRSDQHLVDQFPISQVQAVKVMIFTAKIDLTIRNYSRPVNLKSRFKIPD